jgi:hypothetical protein
MRRAKALLVAKLAGQSPIGSKLIRVFFVSAALQDSRWPCMSRSFAAYSPRRRFAVSPLPPPGSWILAPDSSTFPPWLLQLPPYKPRAQAVAPR